MAYIELLDNCGTLLRMVHRAGVFSVVIAFYFMLIGVGILFVLYL